jgi:hypothetical protein
MNGHTPRGLEATVLVDPSALANQRESSFRLHLTFAWLSSHVFPPKVFAGLGCKNGNLQLPSAFHKAVAFLRLIRFYNHQSFAIVLFGALFFSKTPPLKAPFLGLISLYFSFNVCLYGGIYTLNAVADADEDRAHKGKCTRPLASGEVSKMEASVFSVLLVCSAFFTSWWIHEYKFFPVYTGFLTINLAYSLWLGRIKNFRFFFVACTAPMQMYMGALLTGSTIPPACLISPYLCMVGAQPIKIRAEYPNKAFFWIDGFCMSASAVVMGSAMGYHYAVGGVVTNTDVAFCGVVALANFVYLLLPMVFPESPWAKLEKVVTGAGGDCEVARGRMDRPYPDLPPPRLSLP